MQYTRARPSEEQLLRRTSASDIVLMSRASRLMRCVRSILLRSSIRSRFHYAAGVDQITVYDDDSVDNTEAILQPFVKAGIVQYIPSTIKR